MSPRLQIHTSNRLTVLLRHLLEQLASPPLPPFEPDVIVVQSQGMSRWLTLRMAEHQGIAMGLWTPFPTSFIHQLAQRLLDPLPHQPGSILEATGAETSVDPSETLAERQIMLWALFRQLGADAPSSAKHPLTTTYLADDRSQVKRYQLAWQLSQLFQDYQLFRPAMLHGWQHDESPQGRLEAWQASLWRTLNKGPEPLLHHHMRRLDALLRAPETTANSLIDRGLPPRLNVFGASTLPPLFLRLLHRLSQFIPVDIYFASPTYHYWGDLRSEREVMRLSRRLRRPEQSLEETHFETGNALLMSLGRQGRDFFNLLQEIDPDGHSWHELDFDLETGDSVLAQITHDILHLINRAPQGDSPPVPLPPQDDSLRVHVCHSPMREMEVLRDALLGLFADPRNAELRPEDVLIMVPDIDVYSPYIEAVFKVEHRDGIHLPISIADRKATHELPAAAAFLQILDLAQRRLTPTDLFDVLETTAILHRFGLQPTDLPTLRQWTHDLRIRWAIDGDQREKEFGVPPEGANTWTHGLHRLLLGYAMGPVDALVAGTAPWGDEGPGDVHLQGHFVALLDALFTCLRRLRAPRPLDQWSDDLAGSLDQLFAPRDDEDERALESIRLNLEELRLAASHVAAQDPDAEDARAPEPVSLEAIREHLQHQLSDDRGSTQFLNGRMTFCALKPMRTIPFKVICIAGLDDQSFPRRQPSRSFDLMQRHPQLGDRSLREDDRYLFLETLLAAQERLLLSYVGFSQKDGAPRAPSIVLGELLEHIDRTFVTDDGRPASAHICVEHRLHPFHPSYFHGADPRSFSLENLEASKVLQQPPHEVPPFYPGDGSEPSNEEAGTSYNEGAGTSYNEGAGTSYNEGAGTSSYNEGAGTSSYNEGAGTSYNEGAGTSTDRSAPYLDIHLEELVRFWTHPCRDYCQQTLGLTLWDDHLGIDGAEPFAVGGLAAYGLEQDMVQRRLQLCDPQTAHDPAWIEAEHALLQARGDLPIAGLGDAAYATLRRNVEAFIERLPDFEPVESPWIHLSGDGWQLSGQLDGLTRGGLVRHRLATLKGRDQRRAWIYHLVWNVARARSREVFRFIPLETHLLARDGGLRLPPIDDAMGQLTTLIEGFRLGRARPLPFFENASLAYIEQQLRAANLRQGQRRTPMQSAHDAWRGNSRPGSSFTGGDRDDPWIALCFRSLDPLQDPHFAEWAGKFWRPLLNAAEAIP